MKVSKWKKEREETCAKPACSERISSLHSFCFPKSWKWKYKCCSGGCESYNIQDLPLQLNCAFPHAAPLYRLLLQSKLRTTMCEAVSAKEKQPFIMCSWVNSTALRWQSFQWTSWSLFISGLHLCLHMGFSSVEGDKRSGLSTTHISKQNDTESTLSSYLLSMYIICPGSSANTL